MISSRSAGVSVPISIVYFRESGYCSTIESVEILVARTGEEMEQAFERLSASKVLGCDTETSGLSAKRGRLFSIQFSDGKFNVLVPISEGFGPGRLAGLLENR